jgi:hypothetical protein
MEHVFLPALIAISLAPFTAPLPAAESKPHVVFVINEDEYAANKTLPVFARLLEDKYGCRTTVLDGQGRHEVRGLEALDTADLLVLFARRRGLPQEQMDRVRKYLAAGKPLVGLRTACHAFAPGNSAPQGAEQWPNFDAEVLGCHYHGHGNNEKGTDVSPAAGAAGHPVLQGVEPLKWHSAGSLYFVLPLDKRATVLLNGSADRRSEPIAWTMQGARGFSTPARGKSPDTPAAAESPALAGGGQKKGGRVFFTSLGHRDDFQRPQFTKLLVNAVFWALDRPAPKR